ncbi:MAG: DNA-binding protein [Desulfohalobiaceae bacterium]|nr:DNA-binding protein [Desulfohalobiaceae bacterium]
MQYQEARQGRIFVLRLEHGEVLHEVIEAFAGEQSIRAGVLTILGGVDQGSRLVVGPKDGAARPIDPMQQLLARPHEAVGTGTLFPDESGNPILHLHLACGREDSTITGCSRGGVRAWQILEAVLIELVDCPGQRALDRDLGFKLLQLPNPAPGS